MTTAGGVSSVVDATVGRRVRAAQFFEQEFDEGTVFARFFFFAANADEVEEESRVKIAAFLQCLGDQSFGDAVEARPNGSAATLQNVFFAACLRGFAAVLPQGSVPVACSWSQTKKERWLALPLLDLEFPYLYSE